MMTPSDPWTPVWIEGSANPDFGGGHSGSAGGNAFETGLAHPHHHIEIDIGTRRLTLNAEDNSWRFGPSVNVVSGDVTVNTDGASAF